MPRWKDALTFTASIDDPVTEDSPAISAHLSASAFAHSATHVHDRHSNMSISHKVALRVFFNNVGRVRAAIGADLADVEIGDDGLAVAGLLVNTVFAHHT